jgi:DNA replication and repair protein RecF
VLGGYTARRSASQGQQKSILLALKFAQSDIIKARYDFPPFMLLDDIFDKLDGRRIENLITLIGTGDLGQTFLTDTNKDRVNMLLAGFGYESKVVEMREGAIA